MKTQLLLREAAGVGKKRIAAKAQRGKDIRALLNDVDLRTHCDMPTRTFLQHVVATLARFISMQSPSKTASLQRARASVQKMARSTGAASSASASASASPSSASPRHVAGFVDAENIDDLILIVQNQKYYAALGETSDETAEGVMHDVLNILETVA